MGCCYPDCFNICLNQLAFEFIFRFNRKNNILSHSILFISLFSYILKGSGRVIGRFHFIAVLNLLFEFVHFLYKFLLSGFRAN